MSIRTTRRQTLLSAGMAAFYSLLDRDPLSVLEAHTGSRPRFLYDKLPLSLTANSVTDSQRTLLLDQVEDAHLAVACRLKSYATPLTQRLFCCAVHSFEQNVYDKDPLGVYLTAGTVWGARKYTRDVSYSGILGANVLFPSLMLSSLKNFVKTREELGWRVPIGWDAPSPELAKVGWVVEPIDKNTYLDKYHVDPYTHKTDDVVWLWCMHDLFHRNRVIADWQWMYEAGKRQFESTYD